MTWKKGRGPYVSYNAAVDEALCFGWVDSRPNSLDDERLQRLVTPRKPTSNWSRVNKERVQRLTAENRMAPAGLAVVEAAKRHGTWAALDDVEGLVEPKDLKNALDACAAARTNWDGFPRSTKRAILEWIGAAKTEATQRRRIEQTVTEAEQGRRANQWRQPKGQAVKGK